MKSLFILLLALVFFAPVARVDAALSVVCVVQVPATDPGTQTGNAAVAVTPCTASMQTGDLVFMHATFVNATGGTTLAISNDGGQSWTSVAQQDAGNVRTRLFHAIWDGTWDANPSVVGNPTGGSAFILTMLVIRGQHATPFDVAVSSSTSTPGADPFPVSIAEVTTTVANAMPIVFWSILGANTFDNFAAGWTNTDPVQIRNTSGSDAASALVYQTKAAAGGTGALTFNTDEVQAVGWYKLAVAPAVVAAATSRGMLAGVGR